MKQRLSVLIPALLVAVVVPLFSQTPPPKSTVGPKGKAPAPIDQKKAAEKAAPKASKAALMDPAKLTAVAPPTYQAKFETTAGEFVVEVHRDWAPKGADRFFNLVKNGFYDDCRFYRVIPNFMVQFGINGDPNVDKHWTNANITDDPVKQSNTPGYITYATAGPNTRTTQVFINYVDNARLDADGFAPFGQVVSGMEIVRKLNSKYGGTPTNDQGPIHAEGNKFLDSKYPGLDYIKKATIVPATPAKK